MTKERIKLTPVRRRDPAEFTVSVSKGWQTFVAHCNEDASLNGYGSTRGKAIEDAKKKILSHCYKMERV